MRARVAGQDGDLKASVEQAFEDCWAEITGGLNMDVSASSCTQQTEAHSEGLGTYTSESNFCDSSHSNGCVRCRFDRFPGLLGVAVFLVR